MKALTKILIGLLVILVLVAGGMFVWKNFVEQKQPVAEKVSIDTIPGNVENISPPPVPVEEVVEEPKPKPAPKPVIQPTPQPKPVVIAEQVEPEPEPEPLEDPYDDTSKVFPPKPYTIQIGSYETPEMAKKEAAQIDKKGYTACLTPIIGDKIIHKVFVGMYPTLAEARSSARKMKEKGVIAADSYPVRVPIALMIGSSESLESAQKLKTKMLGMGYSAYIQSSESGNSFRVMVGAYSSPQEAKENLGKVLASDHLEYVVTDR